MGLAKWLAVEREFGVLASVGPEAVIMEQKLAKATAARLSKETRRQNLIGVDVGLGHRNGERGDVGERLHGSRLDEKLADIGDAPADGSRGSHDGAHKMRAGARPLPADKVAIGRRGAAFPRPHDFTVRAEAHRAPGFAPLEPGALKDVVAVALFGVISLIIPGYGNTNSLLSLLLLSSLLGIAAVGQTLTIIIGGFDMSIPAVISLANVLLALLYGAGLSVWTAAGVITALAIVIGLFNGFASRYLQLNPLVVTLATGSIVLGAIWAGTHGEVAGSVPNWLVESVSVIGKTGPIPLPGAVVLWLAIAAAVVFLERRTVLGRWIFAVGANPRAAEFAGVPMVFVWMAVYVLSSVLAGVTGMLLAGFSGAADPTVGAPYMFTTVAAVVVGGTPLTGGRGGYGRTLGGCLVVTELETLLVGVGLDQPAQQICLGFLIVALATLYGRELHLRMRI